MRKRIKRIASAAFLPIMIAGTFLFWVNLMAIRNLDAQCYMEGGWRKCDQEQCLEFEPGPIWSFKPWKSKWVPRSKLCDDYICTLTWREVAYIP